MRNATVKLRSGDPIGCIWMLNLKYICVQVCFINPTKVLDIQKHGKHLTDWVNHFYDKIVSNNKVET